jgi:hypothetical protein
MRFEFVSIEYQIFTQPQAVENDLYISYDQGTAKLATTTVQTQQKM